MFKPEAIIPGIILAGGASTRMGRPKALLTFPDDTTLLERQCSLLIEGGCSQVVVVLGAYADEVQEAHEGLPARFVINETWKRGQFSSIQMGVSSVYPGTSHASGVLILPIDTMVASPDIPEALILAASHNSHLDAIVPDFNGRGGHPIYLSRASAMKLLELDPQDEQARLDQFLTQLTQVLRLPVSDPGIVTNVNTPAEWERVLEMIIE